MNLRFIAFSLIFCASLHSEEILVALPKADANVGRLARLRSEHHVRLIRSFPRLKNLEIVSVESKDDVADTLKKLRDSGEYLFVEENVALEPLSPLEKNPNDPMVKNTPERLIYEAWKDESPNRGPSGFYWKRYAVNSYQWPVLNVGGTFPSLFVRGAPYITPGTPEFTCVPGIDANLLQAWGKRTDAANVIVAVIDSGIRVTHEDLLGNIWENPGESGIDGSGNNKAANGLDDDNNGYIDDINGIWPGSQNPQSRGDGAPNKLPSYHGTSVAGIIGAKGDNGIGIAGVCWSVKLMPIVASTVADVVAGIDYGLQHGARVFNLSLKFGDNAAENGSAVNLALETGREYGAIFIFGAGNSSHDLDQDYSLGACSNLDNVIVAGGLTPSGGVIFDYGLSTVDLIAPAMALITTSNRNDSDYQSAVGTSYAAPHVSGAVALLRAEFPNDSYQQLLNRLLGNVTVQTSASGKSLTGGRLNVGAAILSVSSRPPNDDAFPIGTGQTRVNQAYTFPPNPMNKWASNMVSTVNNVGATKEPGEPNHAQNPGGRSIWWSWTPTTQFLGGSSGIVRVTTEKSSFDTLLAVYTGTQVSSLTLLPGIDSPNAENDDDQINGVQTSSLRFLAVANTTYRIAVDGKGGACGMANFTIYPPPPVAPGGLQVTSSAASPFKSLRLEWSAVSNASFYRVERLINGTYAIVGLVKAKQVIGNEFSSISAFIDTPLLPDTQYSYRVFACNGGGESSYVSGSGTTQSLPELPSVTLSAGAGFVDKVSLTVNATGSGELRFQRRRLGESLYSDVGYSAGLPSSGTVFIPNSATHAIEHQSTWEYRAHVSNARGEQYSAEVVTINFPPAPAAPSAGPTLVAPTQRGWNALGLQWTYPTGNSDTFAIERKQSGQGGYLHIASVGTSTRAFLDTGLTPGASYTYRVRSLNIGGSGPYSSEQSIMLEMGKTPRVPSQATARRQLAPGGTSTQVTLTWTPIPEAESFLLIKDGNSSAATSLTVNTASVLDDLGDSYWAILSTNRFGASVTTPPIAAETEVPPFAPSNLSVSATTSPYSLLLAWNQNPSSPQDTPQEIVFIVERRTAASAFKEIGFVAKNGTTYTDWGLTPGTTYYYRIRSDNDGGYSTDGEFGGYSNEASGSTIQIGNTPTAPTSVVSVAESDSKISLSWNDASTNEDGFEVFRKAGVAGAWQSVARLGAGTTSFVDVDLIAATQYFYRLTAFNAAGTSAFSIESSITTANAPPAPNAPASLIVSSPTASQINLTWADYSNNELGFAIEQKVGSGGSFVQIATTPPNSTTFCSLFGPATSPLLPGTEYFYRIRAFNNGGFSSYSSVGSAVPSLMPPSAPSTVAAQTLSENQIRLTWTDHSNNESGFAIERTSVPNAGSVVPPFVQIAEITQNLEEFIDSGLVPSTQYRYQIRAFSGSGLGRRFSNYAASPGTTNTIAEATTLASPINLAASLPSDTRVHLNWTDGGNLSSGTGFQIERKIGAGAFMQIATVPEGQPPMFDDLTVITDTMYTYRVREHSAAGGVSVYSNSAEVRTKPLAPTALVATATTSSQISLTWIDNSLTETGFRVERSLDQNAWILIGTTPVNAQAHSDNTAIPNSTYYYRICATHPWASSTYITSSATTPVSGTVDTSFSASVPNGSIDHALLQPDGKLIIGGSFTSSGAYTRSYLARHDTSGALDGSFSASPGGAVSALALQSDGKVLIAGSFTQVNGATTGPLARLTTGGWVDYYFSTQSINNYPYAIAVESNGNILIGGSFTTVSGYSKPYLARLTSTGSPDPYFGPNLNGAVNAIAIDSNGRILIGGSFSTTQSGTVRYGIARLFSNGQVDPSFAPTSGINNTGWIRSISYQSDGNILAGGSFSSFNGTSRQNVVRILTSGGIDSNYTPGASGVVWDGRESFGNTILWAGDFTYFNGTYGRNRIYRTTSTGGDDSAFNAGTGANSQVTQIIPLADGRAILTGSFTSFNNSTRNRIVRIY